MHVLKSISIEVLRSQWFKTHKKDKDLFKKRRTSIIKAENPPSGVVYWVWRERESIS